MQTLLVRIILRPRLEIAGRAGLLCICISVVSVSGNNIVVKAFE